MRSRSRALLGWTIVALHVGIGTSEAADPPVAKRPTQTTPLQRPEQATPPSTDPAALPDGLDVVAADVVTLSGAAGPLVVLRNQNGDFVLGGPPQGASLPGGLHARGDVDIAAVFADRFTITESGSVRIGTGSPPHRLSITGGPAWTANGWKGAVDLDSGSALAWRTNVGHHRFGMGHTNGGFHFFRTGSDPAKVDQPAVYDLIIRDDGTVSVNVLEIKGADLAEQFELAGDSSLEESAAGPPGMVVSIDPENPGKLAISDRAYDRRVAGIVSGARGIGPGALMGGGVASGGEGHPIALTGRVYCWADTSGGAIRPGDLLTTSSRPGHARRVTDHAKAQGAILGKAMDSLEQGTGLILVLVTLQ